LGQIQTQQLADVLVIVHDQNFLVGHILPLLFLLSGRRDTPAARIFSAYYIYYTIEMWTKKEHQQPLRAFSGVLLFFNRCASQTGGVLCPCIA
ncbi:hypothetical protein, partial [Fournierella sp.]|uniref:hypothetical protein n=1 Tax=Allofournierella sp. TaxID=1940256 RepID=UPI0025B7EBAA